MEKKELELKSDKLRKIFNYNFDYESYQSEENLKKKARGLIYDFFYGIISSNLIEKRFYFHSFCHDSVLKLNLCDLIDDVIIDLNHYLKYVEKYKDENSIFYELERINYDYLDINKISEFNSKKYITEKINHIGEIVSILGKKLKIDVPDEMTVQFGKEDYSDYDNSIVCRGGGLFGDYDLDCFWEYITPNATDEAILAKFELRLYLKKVKDIRIEILNSLIVLKYFLKLDFISSFFTNEEIEKINDFYNFFVDFDEKHGELFGHKELGYGERWDSRW